MSTGPKCVCRLHTSLAHTLTLPFVTADLTSVTERPSRDLCLCLLRVEVHIVASIQVTCQNVPGFATPAPLRPYFHYLISRGGKEGVESKLRAREGVGVPRKTVAQYPNYRKSRGAISASAAAAAARTVASVVAVSSSLNANASANLECQVVHLSIKARDLTSRARPLETASK